MDACTGQPSFDMAYREFKIEVDRFYVSYWMEKLGRNVTAVAVHAGVQRTTIYNLVRQLDIPFGEVKS